MYLSLLWFKDDNAEMLRGLKLRESNGVLPLYHHRVERNLRNGSESWTLAGIATNSDGPWLAKGNLESPRTGSRGRRTHSGFHCRSSAMCITTTLPRSTDSGFRVCVSGRFWLDLPLGGVYDKKGLPTTLASITDEPPVDAGVYYQDHRLRETSSQTFRGRSHPRAWFWRGPLR